jgi:thioredoxin-like negative regulator of GroEL
MIRGLQHGCAIAKEQGENAKIAKVDVHKSRTLSSGLGIPKIPALLFFKGGEVKDQSGWFHQ